MKYVMALVVAFASFQALAESPIDRPVTEAVVRKALNNSPALVGAVKEIRKTINTTDCRKLDIVELKQTGYGTAIVKVQGVCFSRGGNPEEGESAAYFTLEGTILGETLNVEKIEFGVAG